MLSRFRNYLRILFGLPKSLFINIHYFGFQGLKFPILVVWRTRLSSIGGRIIISHPIKFGLIRIGFSSVAMSSYHEWNVWNVSGTVTFKGSAVFGTGFCLFVGRNGQLTIGDNFLLTAKSEICCSKEVCIGNNVLLSWDILLMDTDSHPIRDERNEIINPDKPIQIGNNVWVGCRSIILKGAIISNDSVVGAGTIVNKHFKDSSVIIAGSPASVVRKNIRWLHEVF
jgi:acetyltransferase-like isoleucine patch superfamily enzyme